MADAIVEKIGGSRLNGADIFRTLQGYPYPFFLDSSLPGERLGRFSFLGCEPFLIFKCKKDAVILEWADGKKETFRSNPFLALKEIFKRYRCENPDKRLPFVSGGVGYFSYDMKDFTEELPDTADDDLRLPDCIMGFYDVVIIHDNIEGSAYISSSGLPFTALKRRRRQAERLDEFKDRLRNRPSDTAAFSSRGAPGRLQSNFSKSGYMKIIKEAKEYIRKGDIYQVNLSQRFRAAIDMRPCDLYLKLREVSPAPFASYLGFGDVAILSSSPERFLLKRGNYIETRPIKGTRPRGKNAEADLALEQELKNSIKDNAEHIMIVDLERNDLGKICDYGSVRLSGHAVIEKYENVFHMVSTVSGTLRKGTGPVDCLLATFPGGSITGAPKVRSMEIIEELEPLKRSIYTGAIGYISFDGNMDTSIVIRTLVVKDDTAYFSVGGGIVADSDPESEYQETLDKAAGLIRALSAEPQRQSMPLKRREVAWAK